MTKTETLGQLTENELLDLCEHNARKAEKNSLKVPNWTWPLLVLASRQLEEKRGLTLQHEPNFYLKVT